MRDQTNEGFCGLGRSPFFVWGGIWGGKWRVNWIKSPRNCNRIIRSM